MNSSNKYPVKFLKESFIGCVSNKTEILEHEFCGCYNCLKTFKANEIIDWILEPDGKEDSAACPNCTFDSVLSSKYPVDDQEFLIEMRIYHFGN